MTVFSKPAFSALAAALLSLSLNTQAQDSGVGALLGDLLGQPGNPNPPAQPEAQRRVWGQPPPAQARNYTQPTARFDALLVQTENDKLILYPFSGQGFLDGKLAAQDWDSQDALVADWNRDGATDVLSLGSDGRLRLYLQLNGTLQPAQPVDARAGFTHIFQGDFDGDGNLEAVARQNNGDLYFYPFKSGAFQAPRKIGNGWSFTHYWARDWNNDGTTDFMVRTPAGELILYPVRGGTFQEGSKVGQGWQFADYFAEDWNGDNGSDLLVRTAEGEVILYPFHIVGGFEPGHALARGWRFSQYFPGDWDGDGRPDMLARDSQGGLALHLMRQNSFLPAQQVGQDWHFQGYIPFRYR